MKFILIIGSVIVTVALVFYSVAIFTEQRRKKVSNKVLIFLTLGVLLDITATTCMIIGSENSPFTLHGIIGYSSLTGMLFDAFLLWRFRLIRGAEQTVSKFIHFYSRFAYGWWVLAYLTGSLLVSMK